VTQTPSKWVVDHIDQITCDGHVLDLACGTGRHTRFLLNRGFRVTAVDIDTKGLADLPDTNLSVIETDLETDPKAQSSISLNGSFDGIVVTNYLHRPLFGFLIDSLESGGILIYQTFMEGNERLGKPSNPDFLLRRDELKKVCSQEMTIINFSQGYVEHPGPAFMQQICARKT